MFTWTFDSFFENISDGLIEHEINISSLFRTGFHKPHLQIHKKKVYPMCCCKLLRILRLNLPPIAHIEFIPHQKHNNFGSIGILVYLIKPILDPDKRFSICDIVHKENSLHASEVLGGDCFVFLLACCIPYYRIDLMFVHSRRIWFPFRYLSILRISMPTVRRLC